MLMFLVVPLILSLLLTPSPPISFWETGKKGNILLLTAHPDDEAMFFAPTILSLVDQGINVYGLCLSNGNSEGLGKTREVELKSSYKVLGIPEHRVTTIDDIKLPDNITQTWPEEIIANYVSQHVKKYDIATILTFDNGGVSEHPNHVSLLHGAKLYVSKHDIAIQGSLPPSLFMLETMTAARKYHGIFHPIATRLVMRFDPTFMRKMSPTRRSVVSDITRYNLAMRAMRQHKSQLVWFRWLYILFSRYMWVNDWIRVSP